MLFHRGVLDTTRMFFPFVSARGIRSQVTLLIVGCRVMAYFIARIYPRQADRWLRVLAAWRNWALCIALLLDLRAGALTALRHMHHSRRHQQVRRHVLLGGGRSLMWVLVVARETNLLLHSGLVTLRFELRLNRLFTLLICLWSWLILWRCR